ncbi:MAG TPA: OB-fold domain-containing protein [Variovorax sp.]|nr:OB-fold domain-containing protein [Variovorax sp.]
MTSPLLPDAQGGVQVRHQAALNDGRFLIQRCGACGQAVYFPRELCPHCGGAGLAWETPAGTGTVYSVTTVRRKPDAGGDLNVSLIELDEGVRLMSRVEGLAPAEVRIGQRVRARVVQQAGAGLVVFDAIGATADTQGGTR